MKTLKKKTIKVASTTHYFNEITHDAIVRFQQEENKKMQEVIYKNEILPAFDKLVENLIYIHCSQIHIPFEEFKNDCIVFLFETLRKFDASKGTKAFSYFNVVAKNWIIVKSRQYQKNANRCLSVETKNSVSFYEKLAQADAGNEDEFDFIQIVKNDEIKVVEILESLKNELDIDNDINCINAIIHLFKNADNLESLSKRAIFIYIRDMTNLNSKQLALSLTLIRKKFKILKEQYVANAMELKDG